MKQFEEAIATTPSDEDLPEEIRAAIEVEGDEVVDLHV
ncbi:hypothetical protein GGR00_005564 [Aminobacter aganoensis]|uniref:Uncharacterized protein n=1 Tax=Aminobacter aganoensis TaxID=83264 RepID=A0A7X0FDK2_9HYPH|nr:hypothetical protein [Aminobacter aganoensis]